MKTKLISILLVLFIYITVLAGCTAELEKSEYSQVLKAAFFYTLGEITERNSDLILDVSSFNEEDISDFIEFATEQFSLYPDQYIIKTASNKETLEKDTPSTPAIFSFSFNKPYDDYKIKSNTTSFATVFVNIVYHEHNEFREIDEGYGFALEIKKTGDNWEVVDYNETWRS